jgi:GNAT superfamily N-acetyltransferase
MGIVIEKLQFRDLDSFWQVFSQLLQTDFPGYSKRVVDFFLNKIYIKDNFRQWLMTGWKIVLLAKRDGQAVGFAVLDKPYGGVCFCRWLGVLKDYRKKGVGKRLIQETINYAKNYGCHKIELASQSEAKKFYQKTGLVLEGRRDVSYFGIDQFIFGKVIGQPKDEVMVKE